MYERTPPSESQIAQLANRVPLLVPRTKANLKLGNTDMDPSLDRDKVDLSIDLFIAIQTLFDYHLNGLVNDLFQR